MPKKPKKKPKPYDPLAPSFKYQKGFNKAVKRRARAQVQPLLQDVGQRRREAVSANTEREADIGGMYGAERAARTAGNTQLKDALTGLMSSMGGMGTEVQNAMQAALGQSQAREQEAAAQLGVVAPGQDPSYLAALAAGTTGNKMGLGGDMATALTRGAANLGISGVGERNALENEDRRYQGIISGLDQERTDIRSRLPGIMETMRGAIGQEEMGKLVTGEQMDLARDQFGEIKRGNRFNERMTRRQHRLAKEQFGETKKQNKASRQDAKARLKLDEGTLQLQRDQLEIEKTGAVDEAGKKAAENKAKQFDSAVEWLTGFLAPGDQDKVLADPEDPSSKMVTRPDYLKTRSFDEAYEQLRARYGLGPLMALGVLASAPIPRWRERSAELRKRIKANRLRKRTGAAGPPSPVVVGDQR